MARELTIVSPEKVSLEYRLAGLGSRVIAELIDVLLWMISWLLLLMAGALWLTLMESAGVRVSAELADAMTVGWMVLGFVLVFAYPIFFEIRWNGQTPGKKALGLRVIMDNGAPVDAAAAFKRGLSRVLDGEFTLYMVGAMVMFFSPRNQRIGDMIAGSVVVQERKHNAPIVMARTFETATLPEVAEHPLAACIGTMDGLSPDDYRAIKHFLERRPELPIELQHRYATQMLSPLIDRLRITMPPSTPPSDILEAVASRYAKVHGLLG